METDLDFIVRKPDPNGKSNGEGTVSQVRVRERGLVLQVRVRIQVWARVIHDISPEQCFGSNESGIDYPYSPGFADLTDLTVQFWNLYLFENIMISFD